MRSILAIASIHAFPRRSIEFVLSFPQSNLDMYVFMDIPLGTVVYKKILHWVLESNTSIYGLKKASTNWFDLLNMVQKIEDNINLNSTLVYSTEMTQLY